MIVNSELNALQANVEYKRHSNCQFIVSFISLSLKYELKMTHGKSSAKAHWNAVNTWKSFIIVIKKHIANNERIENDKFSSEIGSFCLLSSVYVGIW